MRVAVMDAKELIEARQKLGLDISEIAKALKTPRGTYLKWERGERRVPGIVEVALMAVTQDWLRS